MGFGLVYDRPFMWMQPRSKSVAVDFAPRVAAAPDTRAPRLAPVPVSAETAVLAGFLELSWAPLVRRMQRGEGALLAVNATWVAFAWPGWGPAAFLVALSTAVLMAAYALNDWHDAEGDLRDPKKHRALVLGLIARRRPFGLWLAGLHVALVVVAAVAQDLATAAAVATMLGINALYSWRLKGVPLADLAVVGLWGAAFVAIVGAPVWLCAAVGLMTSIMHLFQIQQDRPVDAANHIETTVVRLPGAALVVLTTICAALAVILLPHLGPLGALSAAVPLALRVGVQDNGRAWMACRVYCGLALLAALGALRGVG